MLTENTLFGIVDKVAIAIERFKTFEPEEGYYGAFSGGKDSIVIKELARMSGVKIDWYYQHTTVDPPELVYFIRKHHADVNVNYPKLSMWQLIQKKGMPPTRIARYCCQILKESAGTGVVVTGVRWAESGNRAKRRMFEHCNRDKKKMYLHPIIDWSDAEVWEFIKSRNMPYCELYDQGFKRLGCIGCPMARTDGRRAQFERWPTYKKAYLTAFRKMLEERDRKGTPSKLKWKNAEEVMEWWMADRERGDKPNENQCELFT